MTRVNSTFAIKQYGYHGRILKISTRHDGKHKHDMDRSIVYIQVHTRYTKELDLKP